jgi:hypothetical protein
MSEETVNPSNTGVKVEAGCDVMTNQPLVSVTFEGEKPKYFNPGQAFELSSILISAGNRSMVESAVKATLNYLGIAGRNKEVLEHLFNGAGPVVPAATNAEGKGEELQ